MLDLEKCGRPSTTRSWWKRKGQPGFLKGSGDLDLVERDRATQIRYSADVQALAVLNRVVISHIPLRLIFDPPGLAGVISSELSLEYTLSEGSWGAEPLGRSILHLNCRDKVANCCFGAGVDHQLKE